MLKRILLLLTLLMAAGAVAASPGSWDTGPQPVTYPIIGPSGAFTEQLGDGSSPAGGVAPYYSIMPTNISSPTTADEFDSTTWSTTGNDEFKLRLTLHSDHVLADDPLLFPGQHGTSHLHEFMGAIAAGGGSDYTQLRTDGIARKAAGLLAGTNPGPTINLSAYWHLVLFERNALGDGKDRAKRALLTPLYYQPATATLTGSAKFSLIPAGLGVIFGNNMGDPWNLREQAYVAAANAANVAAGGPSAAYSYGGNGFIGWLCDGVGTAKTNIDDLDCAAGHVLAMEIHSQGCWDGHNGNSPDGRSHVIPMIHASATNGQFPDVCPVGWFKIPELVDKPQWVLKNTISSAVANDGPYGASDAAFQAKARADASKCVTATSGASSATVCAPGGASSFVCKDGCSGHADLLSAWDMKWFWLGLNKCAGIPIPASLTFTWLDFDRTPVGTACNSDTLSTTIGTRGRLNLSSSFTPRTNSQVDGDAISDYYPTPVPQGRMGPMTMPTQ